MKRITMLLVAAIPMLGGYDARLWRRQTTIDLDTVLTVSHRIVRLPTP